MVPVDYTGDGPAQAVWENYSVLGLRPRGFFSLASTAALLPRFAGAALAAFFATSSGSMITAVGAFFWAPLETKFLKYFFTVLII
jgi:hypothetical protein